MSRGIVVTVIALMPNGEGKTETENRERPTDPTAWGLDEKIAERSDLF